MSNETKVQVLENVAETIQRLLENCEPRTRFMLMAATAELRLVASAIEKES